MNDMQAKRVNGTEGVALMERLDPNSPVYAVRWDIKENKGTTGSSAFGVNYMEAMFAHEPAMQEVASTVADWLRSETGPEPLLLDGDRLWFEPEERNSLESYLQGTEGTVKLRTLEGTLRTLDAAVALRVIQEMNAYAVALESYLQGVAEKLNAAEDMEGINAVDLYGGKPEEAMMSEMFIQDELIDEEANSPTVQATKLASMVVNKVPLTAAEALSLKALFPVWGSARLPMGTKVAAGFRFTYEGTLYEVVLEHALQADWLPGVVPACVCAVPTGSGALRMPSWGRRPQLWNSAAEILPCVVPTALSPISWQPRWMTASWALPKSCAGATSCRQRRASWPCCVCWACLRRGTPISRCCWTATANASPSGIRA